MKRKQIVENPDEDTESFLSRVRLSHRVKFVRAQRPVSAIFPKPQKGNRPLLRLHPQVVHFRPSSSLGTSTL